MKKIRVVLTVLLVLLIAFAWFTQITTNTKNAKEYALLLDNADHLYEERLYQQAIQVYEEAMEIKDDSNVQAKWISAYELGYLDGVVTKKEYSNALNEMCAKQPNTTDYWEKLVVLCIDNGEYTAANDYLQKANRSGVKSEKLTELADSVTYSFTEKGKTYTAFYRSSDGYYTVYDDKDWGAMSPDGEWFRERMYYYVSPVGLSHETVLMTSRDVRILDEEGIVLGIFNIEFEQMRAPCSGVIPVYVEEKWSYYDYAAGKYSLIGYDDASSFIDGIAAVKKDGTWRLINTQGEYVCDTRFDDIKLHGNGDYAFENVMVAKENGTYGLYDAKGNTISEFRCKDADAFYGEPIAYQDNSGKWGYVDSKGEVVHSPEFDEVKSFSHGLAAVRTDNGWGYMNELYKVVIEGKYYDADYFTEDGVVMVSEMEGLYHVLKLRFA